MATSNCLKCGGTSFEMKEAPKVKGSQFALMFIQCASCGAVVGVMDYYSIPSLLGKIADRLGIKIL